MRRHDATGHLRVPQTVLSRLKLAETMNTDRGTARHADRDDADEVPPPGLLELRPARPLDGGSANVALARGIVIAVEPGRRPRSSVPSVHRMLSRDFVRQNEMPEIDATITKMMIATALASP